VAKRKKLGHKKHLGYGLWGKYKTPYSPSVVFVLIVISLIGRKVIRCLINGPLPSSFSTFTLIPVKGSQKEIISFFRCLNIYLFIYFIIVLGGCTLEYLQRFL
jgi:hypothetical protein